MAASQGQREKQREKVGGEANWPGRCQGYGNREDSKDSWRVLPNIGVMLQGEEGRLAGTARESVWDPELLESC